jgi:molybdopterin converting factor subunit 1
MKIHLKFFATLRDRFRTAEREIEIEAPREAGEIFFSLFEDKDLAKRWARSIRFAVNSEYVAPETLVKEGDELAFIPPVSGG